MSTELMHLLFVSALAILAGIVGFFFGGIIEMKKICRAKSRATKNLEMPLA